jgi:hypothetical protein
VTDALRRQLAAEHELRRSLERALHDGPQQQLVALAVQVQLARQLAETDPATLLPLLDELAQQVHAALDDLRLFAWRVYPSLLLDGGLVDALHALAHVETDGVGRHPAALEATVYFCCAELVEGATLPASIVLRDDESALRFEVRSRALNLDLRVRDAVRDRVAAFGGDTTFTSEAACGVIPLTP